MAFTQHCHLHEVLGKESVTGHKEEECVVNLHILAQPHGMVNVLGFFL